MTTIAHLGPQSTFYTQKTKKTNKDQRIPIRTPDQTEKNCTTVG